MTQLRMPQTQNNTWTAYEIDQILRDTMKQSGQGLLFIDLDDVANTHIDVQWLRCKLTSLTAEMPGSYAFVIAVDDSRLTSQPIDMPISTSVIHFADYTADELMTILQQRLDQHGYSMTDEAAAEVYEHIRSLCSNRSSGLANARTIRHLYTAVTSAAELRNAQRITKDDILSIKWKQINTQRIGFGA
jgi:Cdc6-like AAA superfamily ATPase